jgi:putative addiction module component (TIGR02574 family)
MTLARKSPCDRLSDRYFPAMNIAELRKLPPDEKLKIIETLWGDIAADEESFESPAWHAEELRKTEADLAAGRIEVLDWEDAKKELRKRFE